MSYLEGILSRAQLPLCFSNFSLKFASANHLLEVSKFLKWRHSRRFFKRLAVQRLRYSIGRPQRLQVGLLKVLEKV